MNAPTMKWRTYSLEGRVKESSGSEWVACHRASLSQERRQENKYDLAEERVSRNLRSRD